MTEHTPTPWKDGPVFSREGKAIFCQDYAKPGRWQKRVDDKTGVFSKADAAYIVRAVNAHDDMLAALQLLSLAAGMFIQKAEGSEQALMRAMGLAGAALAKAKRLTL